MKANRACLLVCLALAVAASAAETQRGVTVIPVSAVAPGGNAGLFVGVNKFTKDQSLRSLNFAVNDAIAQAHLFVIELKLMPPANACLALSGEPFGDAAKTQLDALTKAGMRRVEATKSDILSSLLFIGNVARDPSDLVVVSISSHGFEERGAAYILPTDGLRGAMQETGLNLASVEQRLAQSKASKRLLLIDACREQPTTDTRNVVEGMSAAFRSALATAEGQAVLASCDAGQMSIENIDLGHGVFTHFLLKALRGEAAADARGFITLGAVSEYVAKSVHDWVARNKPGADQRQLQQPWFKGPRIAGEIPLAVDSGIKTRQTTFKNDVAQVVEALKPKINRKGEFTAAVYDRLADGLEQAQEDEPGRNLLKKSKDFVAGKLDEDAFVAYLERVLETPAQRTARLSRETGERADREKARQIASLLATAQANDSKEKGKTALAALNDLLKLDPAHKEALALHAKISAYYGPSKEAPWTNSLGMKFVPVKGTEVLFSIWETRVQDYEIFVSATKRWWPKPGFEQGPTHPAVNVGREDAKAFCTWLTEKERSEGRLQTGQEYRLPTDAEWSTAVGLDEDASKTPEEKDGKIRDVYPWGRQWPPPRGAGNYSPGQAVDDYQYTSPVGSFDANQFGLFDMGGNVSEWCADNIRLFIILFYSSFAIGRGGSWRQEGVLSSARATVEPYGGDWVGFRCVLVVASSP